MRAHSEPISHLRMVPARAPDPGAPLAEGPGALTRPPHGGHPDRRAGDLVLGDRMRHANALVVARTEGYRAGEVDQAKRDLASRWFFAALGFLTGVAVEVAFAVLARHLQ